MFPNEQGDSNIKTASGCNTKNGFPIKELDFITNQISIFSGLDFDNFQQNKQLESYLNFINKRKDYVFTNEYSFEILELDETKPTKYLDLLESHTEEFFFVIQESIEQNQIIEKIRKIYFDNQMDQVSYLAFSELKNLLKTANFVRTAKYYLQIVDKQLDQFKRELLPIEEKNKVDLATFNEFILYPLIHFRGEIISLLDIEEKPKDEELKTEIIELPYLELKTQKDQIRLLYDLGVIDFLRDRYKETLSNNNNQTAHLLAQILKLSKSSIQPTVNALLNDDPKNKNYPKESNETKGIIDKLNSAEPK
jgi:hypothetical protein